MKIFPSKLSQLVSYFSVVIPLLKSAEFIAKRHYVSKFLERCFYYNPIKRKHITVTNRENTETLSLSNGEVSLPNM